MLTATGLRMQQLTPDRQNGHAAAAPLRLTAPRGRTPRRAPPTMLEATHSMYRLGSIGLLVLGRETPGVVPGLDDGVVRSGDARGGGDGHSGRTCRAGQHDQHGDSRSPLHDDPPVGVVGGLRRETSGEEHWADATSAPALRPTVRSRGWRGAWSRRRSEVPPGWTCRHTSERLVELHCERGCDGDVLGAGAARAGVCARPSSPTARRCARCAASTSGATGRVRRRHGASGCGKSTLLNLVAGLDTPSDGEIVLAGEPSSGRTRMSSRACGAGTSASCSSSSTCSRA